MSIQLYYVQVVSLVDVIDVPDVIPTDDIAQHSMTITSVIVQWKEPGNSNAPLTMYTLNLCEKINDCKTVTGYPRNISAGQLRYGLLLIIVDVVICSYLHRYNIRDLRPFSSYLFNISAINDIGSANFSSPVPIRLVNRSEIVLV